MEAEAFKYVWLLVVPEARHFDLFILRATAGKVYKTDDRRTFL